MYVQLPPCQRRKLRILYFHYLPAGGRLRTGTDFEQFQAGRVSCCKTKTQRLWRFQTDLKDVIQTCRARVGKCSVLHRPTLRPTRFKQLLYRQLTLKTCRVQANFAKNIFEEEEGMKCFIQIISRSHSNENSKSQ